MDCPYSCITRGAIRLTIFVTQMKYSKRKTNKKLWEKGLKAPRKA